MGGTRLSFFLLGPLLVTVAGTPVALGTPKQRALLAMLLINRNRPVSQEALIDGAWEDSPAATARANIHSYVSNLRRLLGGAGVDPYQVLASAPPGYQLAVADGDCDLDRFIAAKTAGLQAAAAGRFERASGQLVAALKEWRGPALDDLRNFAFAEQLAAALMKKTCILASPALRAEIACGRAESIIGELEKITTGHPYREPLSARLITAYSPLERQSGSPEAYRRLKTALADDLDIDPGTTVNTLREPTLREDPSNLRRAARPPTLTTWPACTPSSPYSDQVIAGVRDATGKHYPLRSAATRIGRLSATTTLSSTTTTRAGITRVIVDAGGQNVITDLQSVNSVQVQDRRIRDSATLTNQVLASASAATSSSSRPQRP